MAFLSAGIPSAGAYLTSAELRRDAAETIASIGALLLGSPPPKWITGSPFSFSIAALSFKARVGEALMVLAI